MKVLVNFEQSICFDQKQQRLHQINNQQILCCSVQFSTSTKRQLRQ